MGTVFAFANQKGGVGKTTTAVNLGAFLARRGRRVLLIDLDPQGNASASLGVDRFALTASVYDALMGSVTLGQLVMPTTMEGLAIVPSNSMLAGAEVELADTAEREYILRRGLWAGDAAPSDQGIVLNRSLRDEFDIIFVDCPPSLGVLTVNALSAADYVLVPVQCEYLALEGLAQLMQTITLVRENLNPELLLFGLVMTMYDPRARLGAQVIQEVRTHFSNMVFDTVIPRNVRVAEAPSYGEPLVRFDPHSRGAEAYAQLANEFLAREAQLRGTAFKAEPLLPSASTEAAPEDTATRDSDWEVS